MYLTSVWEYVFKLIFLYTTYKFAWYVSFNYTFNFIVVCVLFELLFLYELYNFILLFIYLTLLWYELFNVMIYII